MLALTDRRNRNTTAPMAPRLVRPELRCMPLVLVAALLSPLCGCGSGLEALVPPLDTVANVDVSRYTGKWYEIARYPNWFQSSCASSTAEYTANADGTIGVLNT